MGAIPTINLWIGDPPLRRAAQAFMLRPTSEESLFSGSRHRCQHRLLGTLWELQNSK